MSHAARLTKQGSPTAGLSLAKAKATLSAVVDTVEQKRTPITILRRGIPVAQIIPFPETPRPLLRGSMAGTARELGDIVSPRLPEWTVSNEWTRQK